MRMLCLASILALAAPAQASELLFQVENQHGDRLEHAVVTLKLAGASAKVQQDARVAVAQSNQQFNPRVLVIPRGSAVRFPNMDITQHHVYSFSPVKTFELELYSGDDVEPVVFEQSGIVALGCNIHDWMLGYVYITDDAVFGVSDANGQVRLDVDPETIQSLSWWHPAATDQTPRTAAFRGLNSQTLTVVVDSVNPLAFELDPLQDLFAPSP